MDNKDKLAMQVVSAMNCKETTRQVIKAMFSNLSGMLEKAGIEDVAPEFSKPVDEIMDEVMDAMEVDELMEIYSASYAKNFSEEELEGILEVVSSKYYHVLLGKTPELMVENMEVTQTWISNRTDKVMDVVEKYSID